MLMSLDALVDQKVRIHWKRTPETEPPKEYFLVGADPQMAALFLRRVDDPPESDTLLIPFADVETLYVSSSDILMAKPSKRLGSLSSRALDLLEDFNCVTVKDVTQLSKTAILERSGAGQATIQNIERALAQYGFRLKP